MLNRKLITPIAAAFALSILGSGAAIAQSPDATANPRTPNERSSDSAPTPSYGVDDRTNRGTSARGTTRSRAESRSYNQARGDNRPYAFPGDPNDKNNND